MNWPDITPPLTPASSPLDIGIMLFCTIAGMFEILTVMAQVPALAIGHMAMFGYGIGTGEGDGGAGVRHTSGMPMHWPAAVQDAGNMAVSFLCAA